MKHFFLALCLMFFGLLASAQQTIIPFNDNWKYLDNGSNQGTAWRSPSFNDESWKTGAGKLGYGAENINTVVGYGPVPSKKYITTYFRKSFTLSNPAAFAQYTALIRRDDGLIV